MESSRLPTGPAGLAADRDVCIGSERCVSTAPGTFTTGEDGLVRVVAGDWDEPAVRDAVLRCPVGALSWL